MREVFTIGYGGRDTSEFITILNRYRIDTLVDVRSQPYSRYMPDFSSARLSRILNRAGIRYEFMGDSLGGRPKDQTCYSYGPQRKKKLLDARKVRIAGILPQERNRAMCYALSISLSLECNDLNHHLRVRAWFSFTIGRNLGYVVIAHMKLALAPTLPRMLTRRIVWICFNRCRNPPIRETQ